MPLQLPTLHGAEIAARQERISNSEVFMSEKKRQKKEGREKNKVNQARRQNNPRKDEVVADPPQQAKDASNLSEIREQRQ